VTDDIPKFDVVQVSKQTRNDVEALLVCYRPGLPRANGQVERINRTIIPVLSKMSERRSHEMVQTCSFTTRGSLKLNIQRSINTTPF
ncbi:hypothetical protein TNCV_2717231, partial [Trichonephila clavipes]